MMLIKFLTLLTVFLSAVSWAKTITRPPSEFTVNNNELVQVTFSSKDLNRLIVKDDKIKKIQCPKGFCSATSSGNAGWTLDIRNSPTVGASNRHPPFSFFVETKKGKTFSVLAVPTSMRAQTALFKIPELEKEKFDNKFNSMPYETFLKNLMSSSIYAFEHKTNLSGYKYYPLSTEYPDCDKDEDVKICVDKNKINSLPVAVYHNGKLNVLVYKLVNKTDHTLRVYRSRFYGRGLSAIALVPDTGDYLPANGFTYMYQIVQGRGAYAKRQ